MFGRVPYLSSISSGDGKPTQTIILFLASPSHSKNACCTYFLASSSKEFSRKQGADNFPLHTRTRCKQAAFHPRNAMTCSAILPYKRPPWELRLLLLARCECDNMPFPIRPFIFSLGARAGAGLPGLPPPSPSFFPLGLQGSVAKSQPPRKRKTKSPIKICQIYGYCLLLHKIVHAKQ